jgi:uncharacterized membrane protein
MPEHVTHDASPGVDGPAQATLIVMGTRPLVLALVLASVLTATTVALVARIAVETGHNSHVFLLWNLMLAWVPLLFALALEWRRRHGLGGLASLFLGAGWLLFLPNAPYLVTDILHLGHKNSALGLRLDLTTLLAAAACGVLIGFMSLALVQRSIGERLGPRLGWMLVVVALALTSFGIYLGRILRLNSWDVLTRPRLLAHEIAPRLSDPLAHPHMLTGMAVVTAGLLVAYLVFYRAALALERSTAGSRA